MKRRNISWAFLKEIALKLGADDEFFHIRYLFTAYFLTIVRSFMN